MVTIEHLDAAATVPLVESVVVPLYVATHLDQAANPFYSGPRFEERLRGYLRAPGFALALARDDAQTAVGMGFGYPLQAVTRWWQGLVGSAEPGFTTETGRRTFALNELMVHPSRQRQGVAHALHDALMRSRPEERATLLVRADNETARAAYFRWGWRVAGQVKPFPDSPTYDALMLQLSGESWSAGAGDVILR